MLRKMIPIVFILFAVSIAAWAAENPALPRMIYVNGEAEVKVEPDEVVLTIGVETSNKNLGAAKTQNDRIVKEILAVTAQNKIAPKYVQTDYFTIEPKYDYRYSDAEHRDANVFVGYFVRKNVVVTIKEVEKYEAILSGVLEAGANFVQGIQFRTTELRKYRDQARVLAVKAAKEKAELLAGELGLKVGKAWSVNEDSGGWYSWYNNNSWGNRNNQYQAQNAMANSGGNNGTASEESTIAPGQISVNARVTISFELE
jgi:uncharacterized protein YggE